VAEGDACYLEPHDTIQIQRKRELTVGTDFILDYSASHRSREESVDEALDTTRSVVVSIMACRAHAEPRRVGDERGVGRWDGTVQARNIHRERGNER